MARYSGVMLAIFAALGFTPTARAAGHPDLTGVWMMPTAVHAAGFPMQGGITPWAPASEGDPRKKHIPTLAEITAQDDIRAARLQASHGDPKIAFPAAPKTPPAFVTAAGKGHYAAFDQAVYDDHDLNCYPFNVLGRVGGGLGALDIVAGSTQIMMATEINGHNFPRIIYLDGRSDKDAFPSFEGYSVGSWQGSDLSVTTTKIKGDYFNRNWPLSLDAVLTEDYRVVGSGKSRKLEIMQTLSDPKNYVEPLQRVSYLDWRPDLEVHDFPCEEGKDSQAEMAIKPAK